MSFENVKKPFIIGEIGINHNGDVEVAKKIIDSAVNAGCDAVKFQKRDIKVVYTEEELKKYRESPWGKTNGEQKKGLEFGKQEYDEIDRYCKEKGIDWFVSCWDLGSQKKMRVFGLKYNKIASAMLTCDALLEMVAEEGKHTFISTGMSTPKQIHHAVEIFRKHNTTFTLLACTSTYPCPIDEANVLYIKTLLDEYPDSLGVGFSNHTTGLLASTLAVCLGASVIEAHITFPGGRATYGSDQKSSWEPQGLQRFVRDARNIKIILGDGKKVVYDSEKPIIEKLRRY